MLSIQETHRNTGKNIGIGTLVPSAYSSFAATAAAAPIAFAATLAINLCP